jgi:glutaredoxin
VEAVHVEVQLNEMPDCPYCAVVRPVLERVCRRLGIPLRRSEVNVSPRIFGDDGLRHVFLEENLSRLVPSAASEAAADRGAREMLRSNARSIHTPVVVVTGYPLRGPPVRLTIWGAPPEGRLGEYEGNMEALLRALRSSEAV